MEWGGKPPLGRRGRGLVEVLRPLKERKNSKVSKGMEGWRGEGVRSSIRPQLGTGEGRSGGGRWGPARLVGELGSMGRRRKLGRNLNYQKAVR